MYGEAGDRFVVQRPTVGNFAVNYNKVVLWEYVGYNAYHDEYDEPADVISGDFVYTDYDQAEVDVTPEPPGDYIGVDIIIPDTLLKIQPVNSANSISGGVFA